MGNTISSNKVEDEQVKRPARKPLTQEEEMMIENYSKRRSAKHQMLSRNPKGYAVDQCRTFDYDQLFPLNRPNTFNFENVSVPSAFGGASISKEEDNKEYIDDSLILNEKVKKVALLLKNSKHCVVYSGAGISTAASLPDFRGPNGCWTKRDKGIVDDSEPPSLTEIVPTYAHMAVAKLMELGMIKFVITTNMDNLHLRSGVPLDKIIELHGNSFKDRCNQCKHTTHREIEIYKSPLGTCSIEGCQGILVDSIVDFAQPIDDNDWNISKSQSLSCDLSIVLGTSMRVLPACLLPEMGIEINSNGGSMVICNLQVTPYDDKAVKLFCTTDDFMYLLMKELAIEIEEFTPKGEKISIPSFPTKPKDYWCSTNQLDISNHQKFNFLF